MKENYQLSEEKIDLLKHIAKIQSDDLKYHRDFQHKIFVWSSNILLIIIGSLLISKQSQSIIWITYGFLGRLIATFTVFVIVIFSIKWQTRHRIWHEEHREVINKIDNLFHCYEKGYFDPVGEIRIFPERWVNSVKKDRSVIKRLTSINYGSATAILGLLVFAMIWFS